MRRSIRLPRPGGYLPVLLILVLLLCHGVLGLAHQISRGCDGPHPLLIAASADERAAGHADDHGTETPACGHMGTGYFAVVVLALLGITLLGILLDAKKRRRVTIWPPCRLYRLAAFAHPPRGPTLPLLQVFRL